MPIDDRYTAPRLRAQERKQGEVSSQTQVAEPRQPAWYEDEGRPGEKRYWDGTHWTNHLVDGRTGAPVDPPRSRRAWANRYVAAALLALLALAVGAAAGWSAGRNSDKPKNELAAAHRQIAADRAAAQAGINRDEAAARAEISRQQDEAQSTLDDLRGQAADARSTVRDEKAKVASERSRLSKLEGQISGAKATIAANTVPGTGTFVVGSDIQPGTYRADASPGCYWARLSSLDTSDIVDNDNADGPVVIQILPSDKALETDGCSDFHKVG